MSAGTAIIPVNWKSLDTLVLAAAGVEQLPNGNVRVPYRDATGCAWNHKLFAPDGRTWWEESGVGILAPFGLELVARPEDRAGRLLWIAEGESDCLALRQHYAAWRGRPVDVVGLPGSSSWQPEWCKHADGYRGVYCFPDGDQAGKRMADAISDTVPRIVRCYLPAGSDVRGILQGEGPDALDEQIVRAEAAAIYYAGLQICNSVDEFEAFLAGLEW